MLKIILVKWEVCRFLRKDNFVNADHQRLKSKILYLVDGGSKLSVEINNMMINFQKYPPITCRNPRLSTRQGFF